MESRVVLQAQEIEHILDGLALVVLEKHDVYENLMLVGIQRRGADLAKRLQKILMAKTQCNISLGTLDINLYRDDWTSLDAKPQIGQSNIPKDIEGMNTILVDDVLFTGRTIRAALDALLDYGRPKKVELLTLVDRGHRELPIMADYVGITIKTSVHEHVNVLVSEKDGEDAVLVLTKE